MFLWPSIVFQPVSLARSMLAGRVWEKPRAPEGYSAASFPAPSQPAEVVAKIPADKIGRRAESTVSGAIPEA